MVKIVRYDLLYKSKTIDGLGRTCEIDVVRRRLDLPHSDRQEKHANHSQNTDVKRIKDHCWEMKSNLAEYERIENPRLYKIPARDASKLSNLPFWSEALGKPTRPYKVYRRSGTR